jgi:hypothetical protein
VDANDADYYQTASHVYGNHFINAYAPANTASAVKNFKGIDNHVYANIIENCQDGINHSGGGSIAPNTGNKYYNNLILNCANTGIHSRNDGGGPSIENFNNIVVGCNVGIGTQGGVSPQDEHNNCVWDCITASVGLTLDATTLQVDPLLTEFKLTLPDSPCIDAGSNSELPYDDFEGVPFTDPPNMGVYESTAGDPVKPIRVFYPLNEGGASIVMTNTDPDSAGTYDGTWNDGLNWTDVPNNDRFYPINEGTGATLADEIGGNDATIQNFTEDGWG